MPARSIPVAFLAWAFAGSAAPFPAQGGIACAAPEYRQFDFWVGDWEVRAGEELAGTNSISLAHDGCVIVEHWVGSKGLTGTSLNMYHSSTRQWHQTWMDSAGSLLQLSGEFRDGAMRLASTGVNREETLDRITWTPNADGSVRQLWEQSKDGGRSWSVAFDGLYRRTASKPSPPAARR